MTVKIPVTGPPWDQNIGHTLSLIRNNRGFFFSGYVDGDALGTMLSLALYLRLLDKQVFLFLPHSLEGNLKFVKEIIDHNRIQVVSDAPGIRSIRNQVDTVVFCDTANAELIPHFSTISECFLANNIPVIEIDHHFGGDSEALSTDGIRLFRKANACTEIAAELLQAYHQEHPESPNPFIERNILLSLLIGMVTDTAGGKVTPLKDDYSYWIETLGDHLKIGTFSESEGATRNNTNRNFTSPEDLVDHLHQITPKQKECIQKLIGRIEHSGGVGYLNLLSSHVSEELEACCSGEDNWFAPIQDLVVGLVPDKTGTLGMVFFKGKDAHGESCIFVKIRRAANFENCDLRETEPFFQETFGAEFYMGGGGHANAVSFRLRPMPEQTFLKGMDTLIKLTNQKLI